MRSVISIFLVTALGGADLQLPLQPKSVRFAVIGDNGTGLKPQYETAKMMCSWRDKFPFDFVLMLGDNLYGHERAGDFRRKFEEPYKPLLEAGIKFYAALGNHDDPNERFYKPFNMGGQRYYKFSQGNAEFFALDSNYMDPQQLEWLSKHLQDSKADWKICYFHHPLYSDGKFHGADTDLRARIEPILRKHAVRIVLSGHEHIYERFKPQNGIYYFVVGNSGELRLHNIRPSSLMLKGFDTDRTFMMVEIAGDQFCFQVVSRAGETVDSGVIQREAIRSSAITSPRPVRGRRHGLKISRHEGAIPRRSGAANPGREPAFSRLSHAERGQGPAESGSAG
jgi:calcineurin-like phosphoesterase family protein